MHHQALLALLRDILGSPTAPFHEYEVAATLLRRLGALRHVHISRDSFGNFIAHYRRGRRPARYAFGAHMDHPGWVKVDGEPRFLGGVPKAWLDSQHPVKWFGEFGMWDLPAVRFEDGKVVSRACDDLIGCSAIVALFEELERREIDANCYGVFTRAEEVGFVGATRLARRWPLPERVVFVSLETSAPAGVATQGEGPVVRAGDRLSVFDSACTADLVAVAQRERLPVQRKLLDGGSCEATAMQLYGIPSAGISLILDNYHNCGPDHRIEPEAVSLADFKNLLRLLTALVSGSGTKSAGDPSGDARTQLKQRVEKRAAEHRNLAKRGLAKFDWPASLDSF